MEEDSILSVLCTPARQQRSQGPPHGSESHGTVFEGARRVLSATEVNAKFPAASKDNELTSVSKPVSTGDPTWEFFKGPGCIQDTQAKGHWKEYPLQLSACSSWQWNRFQALGRNQYLISKRAWLVPTTSYTKESWTLGGDLKRTILWRNV